MKKRRKILSFRSLFFEGMHTSAAHTLYLVFFTRKKDHVRINFSLMIFDRFELMKKGKIVIFR